jgi:hypothetical protein
VLTPRAVRRTPVLVEAALGNTGDGQTYGTPTPYRGAFDGREKIGRSSKGNTVVLSGTLLLGAEDQVNTGDRVTVGGKVYFAQGVHPLLDAGGRLAGKVVTLA